MATVQQVADQLAKSMGTGMGKDMSKDSSQMDKGSGSTKPCPPATQDITLNLKNRGKAIDSANYGPENPDLPNNKFWQDKADQWDVSVEEAKMSRCGNCAAFNQNRGMIECISKGIGSEGDAEQFIDKADLGYCEIFDFKCAASRSCDAWVTESKDTGTQDEYAADDNSMMEGQDDGGSGLIITIGRK